MNHGDIEVIIPAFDDGSHLIPLLSALNAQARTRGGQLGVVIADDGSPHELGRIIEASTFENLNLKHTRGPNLGPGAARNRGMALASAQWLVFLDADTMPEEDWLERLQETLSANSHADAVLGVTTFGSGPPSPFAHATEIGTGIAFGGANIAYKRQSLASVGGFDERFFDPRRRIHFREDADLHFRARRANLSIVDAPHVRITHPPLRASILTPVRLARRYYFDPLLDKKHPTAFRELNSRRRVGPVSLRYARHLAATGFVVSSSAALVLFANRRRGWGSAATVTAGTTWGANFAALAWRKSLRPRDVGPLAVVSAVVPWTYCANYYRGVLAFRHWPRLR